MARVCTCNPRPAPRQPHTNPDCTWFDKRNAVTECFRHNFVNGACTRCKRLEGTVKAERAQTPGMPEPSEEIKAEVAALLKEVRAEREAARVALVEFKA